MFRNLAIATIATPSPSPSLGFDNSRVQPGPWYGIIVTAMIVALVILLFSLNRHLKRVNFEPPQDEQ